MRLCDGCYSKYTMSTVTRLKDLNNAAYIVDQNVGIFFWNFFNEIKIAKKNGPQLWTPFWTRFFWDHFGPRFGPRLWTPIMDPDLGPNNCPLYDKSTYKFLDPACLSMLGPKNLDPNMDPILDPVRY